MTYLKSEKSPFYNVLQGMELIVLFQLVWW